MKRELLLSSDEIAEKVKELGSEISVDYKDHTPVFVGVLNGVVLFFADLIREVTIPCQIDFIRAASYGSLMSSSGTVKMTKDVESPIENRHVIIVEDIVDTGLTLNRIAESLRRKNPASVKICALIDKLERREEEVIIDYCGFRVQEGFLVGYGLDFNEDYRNLPAIYALRDNPRGGDNHDR